MERPFDICSFGMILQGADGHHLQGNDPTNGSLQHRDAGRYGGQHHYNQVGSGPGHQPHQGHHGPSGHASQPGPPPPGPPPHTAPGPTGPYMDIFGYNNFGPFFPSATQAANTTGNDHFWSKQAIGQPLPGNPYLSVHDEASYYSRDTYGDSFNAGVLKHVETGMGALTLDYIKTDFTGQTVGAPSFQQANPAPQSAAVTQAAVPTAMPGAGHSGIGNSFDVAKRLDSINLTSSSVGLGVNQGSSNVVGSASKKPSWASVASQPAKPVPKSLKSKISGSTVLSSGKHMPPPTPPTSIDSIGTWESKNGSSIGVKNIPGSGPVSVTGHGQPSGVGRHSGSSSSVNPVGAMNSNSGQTNPPIVLGNGSTSWGPSQGNRNVSRSANVANSGTGYIPSSNLNSSAVRQASGQVVTSASNHHHSVTGGGAIQNNHHFHQSSTGMGQNFQANEVGLSGSGVGAVHHHHHRENNRYGGQHQHNHVGPGSHPHHSHGHHHSSSHQHTGSGGHSSNHHQHHLGGHGHSSGTNHHYHGHHGQQSHHHQGHHGASSNAGPQGSASSGGSGGGATSNSSIVPLDNNGPSYPSHPILDKLRLENNYNPKEFDLSPKDARFFIIKSYSEDDIHRSIKYSIWCSTEHGNKRLDNAFKSQEGKGPMYLFYSVNGSGHFCGMAQMLSMVDYNSSSNVWAQDKWKGQFKVKWIYVKDVPNAQLRHIRLENNENKPVTNSRDTQEVPYAQGKAVLKIMHNYRHTTSIFDDFLHYEKRQEEEYQRRVAGDSLPNNSSGSVSSSNGHNNREDNNRGNTRETRDRENTRKNNRDNNRDSNNKDNSSYHNLANSSGHASNANSSSNKNPSNFWELDD